MSKIGGGRKRRSSGADPSDLVRYGGGGSDEAAAFIAATAGELSRIARRHGLETLRHLLDMTQLEAAEWLRKRRRLS